MQIAAATGISVAIALFYRPLRQAIQRATLVPRCGNKFVPCRLVGWLACGRAVTAAPTLNWRPYGASPSTGYPAGASGADIAARSAWMSVPRRQGIPAMNLFPPAHATSPGLTRRGLLAASAPLLMSVADARAQGIAPKRGGTLTSLLTPEPPILVLGVNGPAPTLIVGSKIYQWLITYSPTLEPVGGLANSWAISDAKPRYTFNLHQ